MRRFTILIFGICLFSCSKDGEFEDTYGTKLITIEYKVDTDSWLENYTYSSNDELIKIEDFHLLGRRCEITYLNNLVKEFFTYRIDNNKLIFRDSILYNANGTILAIYKFSINSGENLPLTWIYEFEYSNESRVSKKSTYFVNIGEYTSIEKYYWQGDNITRVEYYNGDELLYYEYFYEYDNKNNYQKERPTSISDPINWSNNNVTKMSYNDYLGNLDLLCRPCIYEYVYNLDNYPVSIKFNSGREMKLSYD